MVESTQEIHKELSDMAGVYRSGLMDQDTRVNGRMIIDLALGEWKLRMVVFMQVCGREMKHTGKDNTSTQMELFSRVTGLTESSMALE